MNVLNNDFLDIHHIRNDTPANAMIRFFFGWKTRNLDLMLEWCQKSWKAKPQAREKLELWFGDIFIIGMKLSKIKQINLYIYNVTVQCGFKHKKQNKSIVGLITGRVVCEKAPNEPSVLGQWGINPLSMLRAFGVYRKIYIDPENLN